MTKKPLRYVVSGALLVGSLSACGGAEHPVNEPRPEVNEAEHGPEVNDPEPNEHAGHGHHHNEAGGEQTEAEVSVNDVAEEQPVEATE